MVLLFNVIWLVPVFCLCSARHIPQWDYFTFVQQWPPSVCIEGKATGKSCYLQSDINYWTIHGLWPSGNKTKEPHCPGDPPFDPNKIKDLIPQMRRFWPDVYAPAYNTSYTFWRNEWTKHGTCAESLPATKTEKLYFQRALKLRQDYELSQVLKGCGIEPSTTTTYQRQAFTDCFKKKYNANVYLRCIEDKMANRVDIVEMRMCMSKEFQPLICRHKEDSQSNYTMQKLMETEGCPDSHIYYLPNRQ